MTDTTLTKLEKPVLRITGGYYRKTAIDVGTGAEFIQFEVDHFADQDDGECTICSRVISEGWLCLDGGEEFCWDCVTLLANGDEL